MLVSALAAASGVPVPTIKYYLREGLLPPGRATGATRAEYGEEHVRRLRLVRALTEVGGLPIARVRDVLACLDGTTPLTTALGTAHDALAGSPAPEAPADGAGAAAALVADAGWRVDPRCASLAQLGAALAALAGAGFPVEPAALQRYARAADAVAREEVDAIPGEDVADAVEFAVLGTVLHEPVLLALRRLAQQHHSARRFGGPPPPEG
ncbi:MerR family transcriptional regulator [Kineococcus esterisolvens]|uniref:MerR family transcriptional regulator n=1 Tax=unclassified Kineococcus TaxID=2621656 RepID=UPI003D7D6A97